MTTETHTSWRDDPVTEKQSRLAAAIQRWTGHVFSGETKGAAADFIDAHYAEAKSEFRLAAIDCPTQWDIA